MLNYQRVDFSVGRHHLVGTSDVSQGCYLVSLPCIWGVGSNHVLGVYETYSI